MKRIEPHLYKHNGGFIVRFVCCDGKRRKFNVGSNLKIARDELGRLRMLDRQGHDWGARKREREEKKRRSITLARWGETYFKDQLSPNELRTGSADREKRAFAIIKRILGDLPLADIKKNRILDYRKNRKAEGVGDITINRELSFLRKLLNVAADQDPPIVETVPRFKLPKESHRARTGTIDEEEFRAILSHMKRPAQRYVICLYETAMRLNEPLKLTWSMVDLKAGLLRLPAEIVKENHPRRTPISWELREVLEELRAEQRKVPNVGGYVFTRSNGQPITSIRTAFEKARHEAKLEHVIFHDLRRTAISRWTAWRVPRDFVMLASGHKPSNVHDRYLNFGDQAIVDAFRIVMVPPEERRKMVLFWSSAKTLEPTSNVSY